MNLKVILSLAFSVCLLAGLATAQEKSERGELWEVQRMEVPPSKASHFVQGAMQIVDLAKANNVPSEHGWHFWSDGYDFIVANPLPNFAALDDPEAWMQSFGEEGQKQLGEVFQKMEKDVAMRPVSRQIMERLDDWSYAPEQTMEFTAGTRYTFQVKPGHWDQFGEMIGTWQELWKAVDYPYAVTAYAPHLGDVGRVEFLIFHDGLGDYMGKNELGKLAEQAGKTELHQKALQGLAEHIDDMEVAHMNYHSDMSYTGPATTASNR